MDQLRGNARSTTAEPTDGQLLERFTAHYDEGAFAELVRRHGPMIHGVCRRVLENEEDVEDAFQATFMILVRKADSIRKRESAASWLYGVALRTARRARVSAARRRERERRAAVSEQAVAPEDVWRDVRPVLDEEVDALPEKFRDLVVLCYMQGHTYAEAARLLHTAVGTVSTRLTQARNLLKDRLMRRGVVLPLAILGTLLETNAAPAAVPAQFSVLALEGGKVAAGLGGSVSAHVAALSKAGLAGSLLTPMKVAILACVLALFTGGVLLYRPAGAARSPAGGAPPPPGGEGPQQKWEQKFGREDQQFLAYSIRISPDDKTFAWQAGDYWTRVADMATGKELAAFQAEAVRNDMPYIRCMGFTPDSRCVITASSDVRLWDIATQKPVAKFPGSHVAAASVDRKMLATVDAEGAIHVIDLVQRKERAVDERLPGPVKALAFQPDGKRFAVGGSDGAIIFYDVETLQRQRRLPGNAEPTLELAFSADGTHLAAIHGDPNVDPVRAIHAVQVWRVDAESKVDLPTERTTDIAFASRAGVLITQEIDGLLATWDPATGQRIVNMRAGSRMLRLVLSPDGESLVTKDSRGSAVLINIATGKTIARLPHSGSVTDAAFTSDGRRLVTGTWRTTEEAQPPKGIAEVKLWDQMP
jgi:RNA polymerase sigma factor (sigma-70 family)